MSDTRLNKEVLAHLIRRQADTLTSFADWLEAGDVSKEEATWIINYVDFALKNWQGKGLP